MNQLTTIVSAAIPFLALLSCSSSPPTSSSPGNEAGAVNDAGDARDATDASDANEASDAADTRDGSSVNDGEAGAEVGTCDGDAGAADVLGRVFIYGGLRPRHTGSLSPCGLNGACPDGETCFRLAAELAVCDIAHRPVVNECTAPADATYGQDECGCKGLSCASGTACSSIQYDCSCQSHSYNTCLETPCTSAGDCPDGSVCTPASLILPAGTFIEAHGRCFAPRCTSDADCTASRGGRCALILQGAAQAGEMHLFKVACVYPTCASDARQCPLLTGAVAAPSIAEPGACLGP